MARRRRRPASAPREAGAEQPEDAGRDHGDAALARATIVVLSIAGGIAVIATGVFGLLGAA